MGLVPRIVLGESDGLPRGRWPELDAPGLLELLYRRALEPEGGVGVSGGLGGSRVGLGGVCC